MKINPISPRLTPINQQKNHQQIGAINFAAKGLKPRKKDVLTVVVNKEIRLTKQQLKNLKLHELNILNYRLVTPTSISGGTFSIRPDVDLKALKENGIKIIVDFRGEATSDFAQRCTQSGFEYFHFNLNNVTNMTNPEYFIREKNERIVISDKFIEQLQEFFRILESGNVYMGCQFGIDRTNIGLFMNYLMNPKIDNAPTIITWPYERKKTVANKNIKIVKKIIKRMTPEQRKQLGIPEDYHLMLQMRIFDLLRKNGLI